MDCFKYKGSQVATDGGYEREVVHRLNEGVIALLNEGVIVPTALYEAEVWGMRSALHLLPGEMGGGNF